MESLQWAQDCWQKVQWASKQMEVFDPMQGNDPMQGDREAQTPDLEFNSKIMADLYSKISQLETELSELRQVLKTAPQLQALMSTARDIGDPSDLVKAVEQLQQEANSKSSKQTVASTSFPQQEPLDKTELTRWLDERFAERMQLFENERNWLDYTRQVIPTLLSKLEHIQLLSPPNLEQDLAKASPSQETPELQTEEDLSTPLIPVELELVDLYNKNAQQLKTQAMSVSETEESQSNRRLGEIKFIQFEQNNRGNFWILSLKEGEYLVPSQRLRINEFNYKTIKVIFACENYQPRYSERFVLIKPAKVSAAVNGKSWQLESSGVLKFE